MRLWLRGIAKRAARHPSAICGARKMSCLGHPLSGKRAEPSADHCDRDRSSTFPRPASNSGHGVAERVDFDQRVVALAEYVKVPIWHVRVAAMIALADCLAMCGLSEDEVLAIAEHEHIPEYRRRRLAQGFPEIMSMASINFGRHYPRRYPARTGAELSEACWGPIHGVTPFPIGASNLQPPRDLRLATAHLNAPMSADR